MRTGASIVAAVSNYVTRQFFEIDKDPTHQFVQQDFCLRITDI